MSKLDDKIIVKIRLVCQSMKGLSDKGWFVSIKRIVNVGWVCQDYIGL